MEYFILGVLLFRAFRGDRQGWMLRWTVTALLIAAIFSMLDEFHQSFVPSRTASPWDSLLDTFAAAVAQIACWSCLRSRDRHNRLCGNHRLKPERIEFNLHCLYEWTVLLDMMIINKTVIGGPSEQGFVLTKSRGVKRACGKFRNSGDSTDERFS